MKIVKKTIKLPETEQELPPKIIEAIETLYPIAKKLAHLRVKHVFTVGTVSYDVIFEPVFIATDHGTVEDWQAKVFAEDDFHYITAIDIYFDKAKTKQTKKTAKRTKKRA